MASEGFLERVKRLESEALSRSGKTQKQLEDELDGVMREYRSLQAVVGPIRTRFHNNEVPEGDARSLLSYLKRDTARLQEIKKRLEAANTALNQVRYPQWFLPSDERFALEEMARRHYESERFVPIAAAAPPEAREGSAPTRVLSVKRPKMTGSGIYKERLQDDPYWHHSLG